MASCSFEEKITVVVPMYNSCETIEAALNSVINQTYSQGLEVIVVNDGSTDGCDNIVENIINNNKTNRKIRLITKKNGGVSTARNRGIREAEGEWIALLDSDDEWLPHKLEQQVAAIKNNTDIEFLGTNVNGEVYPLFGKSSLNIFTLNAVQIILKWYPSTPTILAKKTLFIKAGLFDEKQRQGEDCDLWLRCLMYSRIYILNKTLVQIGHGKKAFGEKGLSADLKKMHIGENFIIKGALQRKQIGLLFYCLAYIWLKVKYLRRLLLISLNI